MATGETPRIESRWKAPRALEGLFRLFGGKKEAEPEPEANKDRFLVLDALKNTDKKKLFATYDSLRKQDEASEGGGISAFIIEVLADEVGSGQVTPEELKELASLFEDEIQGRPKGREKKKSKRSPEQEEMERRTQQRGRESLIEMVERRIRNCYTERRFYGYLTSEEEARLQDEPLHAEAVTVAEKIIGAPDKFGSGLSSYMDAAKGGLAQKEQAFFRKKRLLLSPEDVKRIFDLHPDDYEEAAEGYEQVFAQADVLAASGMPEEAKILRDLEQTYSIIDGTMLRSPAQRLAYVEMLKNPGELRAKWRKEKSKYYHKEWAGEFVAREVIPELLARQVPFEEAVKQIHWFQVAGSPEHLDFCRTLRRDTAGAYRKEYVCVGNYPGPDKKFVPGMMAKLGEQVDLFSTQIEAMRETETAEAFEQRVHEFACHVLHQFTAIHPMADGNGRTGRSLREYIVGKHLGQEKMQEYAGRQLPDRGHELLECLRFAQPRITEGQINTYYGSVVAERYRAATDSRERVELGPHHEPLMAHLQETDIRTEVFGNKEVVAFAARAKDIIDGKQQYARAY